jgi:hypothetical protein
VSPITTETGLEKAIVRMVRAAYPDCWVLKVVGGPFQVPGIPDLLICVEGLLVGMEVKFPGPGESVEHARARATAQQLNQLALIRAAGGAAAVVTSKDEAAALVYHGLARFNERRRDGAQHHQ